MSTSGKGSKRGFMDTANTASAAAAAPRVVEDGSDETKPAATGPPSSSSSINKPRRAASAGPAKRSIIQIYGTGLSECGYCKSVVPSSFSYGVVSNCLLAEDYEVRAPAPMCRSSLVAH